MSELAGSLTSAEMGFPFGMGQFSEQKQVGAISHSLHGPSFASANVFTPLGEELDLIRRAKAGDHNALDQLFACHRPRLLQIAVSMLRNKEDAEDAVQDALLLGYRNFSSFQNRCRFSTWMTRIVINSALMMVRRKSVRPEVSLEEALDAGVLQGRRELADSRRDPEQLCASAEIASLLEKAIHELSPGLEVAIRLRELDGLSTTESTELLGIQRSTFKSRVSRARDKIQESLRPALESRYAGAAGSAPAHV